MEKKIFFQLRRMSFERYRPNPSSWSKFAAFLHLSHVLFMS